VLLNQHGCVALLQPRKFNSLRQPKGYPKNIVSLGDYLLATRLGRSVEQKIVARLLGVCPETLLEWEKNRHEPAAEYYPEIMNFLGYCPMRSTANFGDRIRITRIHRGLSLKMAARSIGIDAGTLRRVELGHDPKSNLRVVHALKSFIE